MAENSTVPSGNYEFTYNKIPVLIISIIGVASNVLLLVAFIKDPLKCFRNSGTYLVINLSVSDCLKCLIIPFHLKIRGELPATTLESIIEFLAVYFPAISFASITSISFDRFLMVAYPIKHRILMKGKLIILWLAAIWIISCVVSVISIINIHRSERNIGYVFGVIIITLSSVMYSTTYYKLKKQSRNLALQNSTESRAQQMRILKEKRFLNTIIIIACVAFVCIVPYMIFYLNYDSLSLPKENLTVEIVETATLVTFYSNFAVNPFIYILRLANYRKTFYLLYCRRRVPSN